MSAYVHETSDQSFDADVLKSNEVVLVDFWAEWCGPCKRLSPILEEVAKEIAQKHPGRFKVYKLNVEDNSRIPEAFVVRGIPCLIIFKGGEELDRKVGALEKSQLLSFVEKHLSLES